MAAAGFAYEIGRDGSHAAQLIVCGDGVNQFILMFSHSLWFSVRDSIQQTARLLYGFYRGSAHFLLYKLLNDEG